MKFQSIVISSGSQKLDNGFGGKGDWELRKVFYEEKGRYGEMFINTNKKTGEVEIGCKDTGYASDLLAGLREELGDIESEEVVTTYY